MFTRLTLIWDRRCEESRTVALRNLFVKKLDFTCNIRIVLINLYIFLKYIGMNGSQ